MKQGFLSMKLISFQLEVDGVTVRHFPFNDSLSIITSKKDSALPGNSVGKSTLGRVLDYLFDGSINPIYVDEEFGTSNLEIEALFREKVVYATLTYLSLNNDECIIKRRLSTEPDYQHYYLNGNKATSKEYKYFVMTTVFNVQSEKPTIRKLAPKFFRTNQHRMLRTVKFDSSRNVSPSDINTVFLYLFNFSDTEILSKIHKLKGVIARYSKMLIAFSGVISEDKIIGSISRIKKEIQRLEKSLLSSEKGLDKLDLVRKINKIDDEENTLSDQLMSLDFKISNILNTNRILTAGKQHYLVEEFRDVYNYAFVKVESALSDFDSAIKFHEQLINTKKEFISDGLESLKTKRNDVVASLGQLKAKKEAFYYELKSKKKIEELSGVVQSIGGLNKELIELSAIVDKKDSLESKRDSESTALEGLSGQFALEIENVTSFEAEFIKNFKSYTKYFYGVEYTFSLHLNAEKGVCDPTVDDIQSNNEGGLKRLEVVTFDLAYIKTVCDGKFNRPNFVLHDSIDDIDICHITKMFEESCKLSGQHIVSLLSDKLPQDIYNKYKKHIILELSQDDKFFTV
jgi:uncharacterized protein YydD (DUF2326 family)